jgi:hypothetical protein
LVVFQIERLPSPLLGIIGIFVSLCKLISARRPTGLMAWKAGESGKVLGCKSEGSVKGKKRRIKRARVVAFETNRYSDYKKRKTAVHHEGHSRTHLQQQ